MNTQVKNINFSELEQKYTDSLIEKIEGKTFQPSTNIELVNTIGNEFVNIVNSKVQLKNFNMRQSKTMNILLFTILSEKSKLAEITVATKEIDKDNLTVIDILVSLYEENILSCIE